MSRMSAGPPVSRRGFLLGALAGVLAACRQGADPTGPATGGATADGSTTGGSTAPTPAPTSAPTTTAATATSSTTPVLVSDPFTLGIASGDPLPDAVILWTRLAPEGGLPDDDVEVMWEVAADDGFSDVVASGSATASAAHAHAVHVDAQGLEPFASYWYRFQAGGFTSPTGHTRTMPGAADEVAQLVIGHASCQHYETGFYAAHRDAAAADLDAMVWLGDYIYEDAARPVGGEVLRSHDGLAPTDLDGYRRRYALYKSDPDLQAAHAAAPWFVIWDDHEVQNNYAGDHSEDITVGLSTFRARRAAAYQAWWEHQPVRLPAPDGADYRTYRQFALGAMATLFLLDGRQYRTDQACGDRALDLSPACPEVMSPGRTMLGDEQQQWLLDGLATAPATWSIVGNQTVLGDITLNGAVLNYDQWDGYPEARQQLLDGIDHANLRNVVALTGDIHIAGVTDLTVSDENGRHIVASELITSSVSSMSGLPPGSRALLGQFPDVRYADDSKRGWVRSVITPTSWLAEFRAVQDITRADSPVAVAARFTIDPVTPGAVPA